MQNCSSVALIHMSPRQNKMSDKNERIQGGNEMVIQQLSNLFSFFVLNSLFCPGHSWNRRKEETEISEIQNENLSVGH